MKLRAFLVATAMGLGLYAGPASAQIVANVAGATDYVFRGVSQTNEGGAIQAGLDMGLGGRYGAYLGLFVSNIDFNTTADAEMDFYVGIKPEFMGWTFDIGFINYSYMGGGTGDLGFYEFKVATSMSAGKANIGLAAYYTPDFTGVGPHDATYAEINLAMPVHRDFTVSGAYGKQFVQDKAGEYATWNAGVTWMPTKWMAVDGRYHDTDEHGLGAIYKARYVGMVKFNRTF
jgi:uncharacterized protein (TIGR02001 family)